MFVVSVAFVLLVSDFVSLFVDVRVSALLFAFGTRCSVFGARYSLLGSRYMILGTRCLALGTWYLVLGTWNVALGIRYSVFEGVTKNQ